MSNFLSSGAGWLARQLNEHTTDSVVYSRGSVSIRLCGTKGRSTFESAMSDGTVMRSEPVDWIFTDDSLCRLLERFDEPIDGDRIVADKKIYEVLSPGYEKPWRYADQFDKTLRIHTKEIN
ncbi:hypothetical protein SH501x_001398 [Pirellulaceae bacterium SH501]